MSRVAKKADFITISIYSVLAAAVIYFSAALGACIDLSLDDEGKADFDNAYLLSNISTEKISETDEQENPDLHTEPVEKSTPTVTENPISEDVPEKHEEFEQSVTLEEIQNIGVQPHTAIGIRNMPKAPTDGGSKQARLDNTDQVVTTQSHLTPPFTEVSEESYLDTFDEF